MLIISIFKVLAVRHTGHCYGYFIQVGNVDIGQRNQTDALAFVVPQLSSTWAVAEYAGKRKNNAAAPEVE